MPDLIAISQGFNALKAATDIVKTMAGLRDSAKLLENTVKLNGEILSVQTALADAQKEQTALVQTIGTLEKEIAEFETWDTEKNKYKLYHLGWAAYAYMLKPATRGTAPPHWVCQKCFSDKRIYVIQMIICNGQRFICPTCTSQITPSPTAFGEAGAPKWLD